MPPVIRTRPSAVNVAVWPLRSMPTPIVPADPEARSWDDSLDIRTIQPDAAERIEARDQMVEKS
jgi:hypothetical protein